jgi:hypothetical protein
VRLAKPGDISLEKRGIAVCSRTFQLAALVLVFAV